jgi:hypothetical protein
MFMIRYGKKWSDKKIGAKIVEGLDQSTTSHTLLQQKNPKLY